MAFLDDLKNVFSTKTPEQIYAEGVLKDIRHLENRTKILAEMSSQLGMCERKFENIIRISRLNAIQRRAAQVYGEILDLPFPDVPPALSAAAVAAMADEWAARILALRPACVLCQGEMTLTARVVRLLQSRGVPVVAACSARCAASRTDADGCTHRQTEFRFVQFREYP